MERNRESALIEQVYKKLRGTIEWNGNDFSKWLKQYEEMKV